MKVSNDIKTGQGKFVERLFSAATTAVEGVKAINDIAIRKSELRSREKGTTYTKNSKLTFSSDFSTPVSTLY